MAEMRDAANENHTTVNECAHLNNNGLGHKRYTITAGLPSTEPQCSQHFL